MRRRSRLWPTLVVLALSATIAASAVSGAPAATQQRVMLVQQHRFGDQHGTFTFHVLTPGRLGSDSGTYEFAAAERAPISRNGQQAAVYVAVSTLIGKRGTLDLRWRVELVGAGNGSTVGTGSWSIVRGTRAYAGSRGSGLLAVVVMTPRGFTTSQFEGLVRSPARTERP